MKKNFPGVTTYDELAALLRSLTSRNAKLEEYMDTQLESATGNYVLQDHLVVSISGSAFDHKLDAFHGGLISATIYYLGLWGGATTIVEKRVEHYPQHNGLIRFVINKQEEPSGTTYWIGTTPYARYTRADSQVTHHVAVRPACLLHEEHLHIPWGPCNNDNPSYKDSVMTVSQTRTVWRKPNWYSRALPKRVELGLIIVDLKKRTISSLLTEFNEAGKVHERIIAIATRFGLIMPGETKLPITSRPPEGNPNAPIPADKPPE